MGMMTYIYGAVKPEEEMIELIRHVVERGVTFFDSADIYGPHTNEVSLGKVKKNQAPFLCHENFMRERERDIGDIHKFSRTL